MKRRYHPGGAGDPAEPGDAAPRAGGTAKPRGVTNPGDAAPHPGDLPALRVQNVTAGYQTLPAVIREVGFTAGRGSVVAILGPNGAGKTTLLNVCLGWHRPAAGTVEIAGAALWRLSRSERGRRISLVPQIDYVPFEYSVLEYVLLGRAPYLSPLASPGPQDAARAREELARLGIAELAGKSVVATSAGERALILIARALVQETEIILMDEPSAHLDLKNKRRIIDLITTLRDTGKTILLTVHEPEFADAVADHIVLLSNGTVLTQGTPRHVLDGPTLTRVYDTPVEVTDRGGRRHFLW